MSGIRRWASDVASGWDRFWFTPQAPQTLAAIRIACGAMLVYVHAIWASLIPDFLAANAWISTDLIQELHRRDWAWSWLWYVESPGLLWLHQILAMLVSLLMMLGLFTRWSTPLAWWMTLMVCHRLTGALFGLDQIVIFLSFYLMFSRCGDAYSLDAWRQRRQKNSQVADRRPSDLREALPNSAAGLGPLHVGNNIATRLIQLHLCVIYLFGGLSKMRGEMWYDGSALWYTAVNFEYQSLNITWLGQYRFIIATLTAATIFWETFYCALVWPKLTRPLVLGMAVMVHAGIALALGMITFGTIMIVANLAFVAPARVERVVEGVQAFGRRSGNTRNS